MNKYILDDNGNPLVETDLLTWARWMETADRRVAYTDTGESRISTIFLGMDHAFSEQEPPILYETMIFGGLHDQYQQRYATRAEALAGHAVAVTLVQSRREE